MPKLIQEDLRRLGVDPAAEIRQLAEAQVRKIIRSCASANAVTFSDHALSQGVKRKITNDMAIECLKTGSIKRGLEPSKGGGMQLRLIHTKAGVTYQVEAALDQLLGPTIVVTVI